MLIPSVVTDNEFLKVNNRLRDFYREERRQIQIYADGVGNLYAMDAGMEKFGVIKQYRDIIEATITETEETIRSDIYPSHMDKFYQLSRDAIFVDAALKGNMRVLRALKRVHRFGKMILDEDRLEELEVDLQQQIELSMIYRKLIDNAMEIFDSIVGYNLNTVMKTLTAVSLLVSVPTLIASIYGMNVGLPLESNPGAFVVVLLTSVLLTIPFYIYLRKRGVL